MTRTPPIVRDPTAFCHRHELRVAFGDTDAAEIVYYANYFRYFEHGRAELLRAAGTPYRALVAAGEFMPVVEAWAQYRAPARYDDLLTITSWLHEVRLASVTVAHEVHRGDELLATGAARLGCVGRDGKARRIPAALHAIARRAS